MKFASIIALITLLAVLSSSSCNDCYENPNLEVLPMVYNFTIKSYTNEAFFVGHQYFQWGQPVHVGPSGTKNRIFSVLRKDTLGLPIAFWWNDFTPPPWDSLSNYPFMQPLQKGETVTLHLIINNTKLGKLECIYKEAKSVTSVLNVNVRVKDGDIVGTQTITQTQYNIPAGQRAVFEFPFEYKGPGNYKLDLNFTAEGIIETDTTDNNYTVDLDNLGS